MKTASDAEKRGVIKLARHSLVVKHVVDKCALNAKGQAAHLSDYLSEL